METKESQNTNQPNNTYQGQQQYQQHYYQYIPTDNMDTFATLHLVKGILTILFSLFFLLYIFLGAAMNLSVFDQDPHMPFNPSIIIMTIGTVGFIITVSIGILTLLAAKYIKERRNYNFIFAIAILNCLAGVLGILLGIFTILDLNKPHVKAQFEPNYNQQNPLGYNK
jgi:hypothetical protein